MVRLGVHAEPTVRRDSSLGFAGETRHACVAFSYVGLDIPAALAALSLASPVSKPSVVFSEGFFFPLPPACPSADLPVFCRSFAFGFSLASISRPIASQKK